MLVIYVICAVLGSVIYTVIKLKINEWLNESGCSMSRLSLKKHCIKNEQSHCENTSPNNLSGTIEISDDESDSSQTNIICESDAETITASTSNQNYDEETLYKFQKSTDSVESNEEDEEPMFTSISAQMPKASMFKWNCQPKGSSGNNQVTTSDSDSSDCYQETTSFHQKQRKKKFKSIHTIELDEEHELKENVPPKVEIQYEQLISGIKVKFPVKPYSCQVAVMNKVIQGCTKSENCLLESPTGTGKTLALLCSVLAWHDHHSVAISSPSLVNASSPVIEEGQQSESVNILSAIFWRKRTIIHKERATHSNDGDHDSSTSDAEGDSCDAYKKLMTNDEDEELDFDRNFERALAKKRHTKIPKIYYGTRTHKQIEQVVKELKKTVYKHKKMTILSSREHTCIQDTTKNKTELCNELLDPSKHKGCPFYNESNKKAITSFRALEVRGIDSVWDIEELVAVGKNEGICPYFAARNLMEHADIIFCPYNYIVDPDIRESMQLNLQDEVIVLDEAHNIEDICRDVASVAFREDHLMNAALECEVLAKDRKKDAATYDCLKVYIRKLVKFIKSITLDGIDYNSDTLSSPYWSGAELLELFNMNELGGSTFAMFLAATNAALADVDKMKEENRLFQTTLEPTISGNTKLILEHLMFSMRMISSPEFVNDYRACVMESNVKDFKYIEEDTWQSFKRVEHRARTLKLICMNPGVIFGPLSQSARCIILASGTLTPINSFQSELNTKFPHVLNAGHVIPKEQVYATCISKGPNGVSLRANYRSVSSWGFQDELGLVLLNVCESVPHGILCFFSSYNVMHKQMERWKNTSIWKKITNSKEVFIEPRYGGDLAQIMREYREVIKETSDGPRGNINGALLLAVFRGKVAEGIDFKDNEARCVISVGIPYAVRKDPVIDMKFKYNDLNSAKGLLKGSEWYSIQAFRALNQALGRCLRHINDWGAVLLVDERFLLSDYKVNLPKWVKSMWVNHYEYNLKEELHKFVTKQKTNDRKNSNVFL